MHLVYELHIIPCKTAGARQVSHKALTDLCVVCVCSRANQLNLQWSTGTYPGTNQQITGGLHPTYITGSIPYNSKFHNDNTLSFRYVHTMCTTYPAFIFMEYVLCYLLRRKGSVVHERDVGGLCEV